MTEKPASIHLDDTNSVNACLQPYDSAFKQRS